MSGEVAPTEMAGEGFTKDYVEKLKHEAAVKDEEVAKLRAFKATHDEKARLVIAGLQPEIKSYMDTLSQQFPDHAAEMATIAEWSKKCHESNALDTATPLARTISCASALWKRERSENSQLTEKSESLGDTLKKLEAVEQDVQAKAQRISELEQLCNDRQSANERMQEELAKAGILKDKFDFSKIASREANATGDAAAAKNGGNVAKAGEASALLAVTSQASRHVEHDLASFVTGLSTMGGSHKISQSATGHAHLGTTAGTVEGEIASAIREAPAF